MNNYLQSGTLYELLDDPQEITEAKKAGLCEDYDSPLDSDGGCLAIPEAPGNKDRPPSQTWELCYLYDQKRGHCPFVR